MAEAYILMKVEPGKERQVFASIKKFPEVADINELYGEWDIIAKIHVDTIDDLDAVVSDRIRSMAEIRMTSTMIVANYRR